MTSDVALQPTVVALIDLVATSSPESLAVHASDGTLTYAELTDRAATLASHLRQIGVRPGHLIGLCVERSANLVVGGLGILMSGTAYIAIDPKYPDQRIQWMLDDAKAAAVVCDETTIERLGPASDRPRIVLGRGGAMLDEARSGAMAPGPAEYPSPTDLAYVVYTSGSTGQPKGVLVDHAALSNLIDWHRGAFDLVARDRCTQVASPGFDATIWEIWPCLATGASLHIVPDELRTDPIVLREWLIVKQITVSFLPTAVAEGIIRLGWPTDGSLRSS